MSDLSAFTPEEKDLLIGVFFRTGKWISHVDDTGDYASDAEEEEKLIARLGRLERDINDPGVIAGIGTEAARRRGDWQNWSANSQYVLNDVRRAGELIAMRLGGDHLEAFRTGLMQIATEVAKAYREENNTGPDAKADTIVGHAGKFFTGMVERFVTKDLNVSDKEAEALEMLSITLKNIE